MKKLNILTIMSILVLSLALAGCNKDTTSEKQEKVRDNVLTRANSAEPAYKPSNFLTREYVNEYMRRMDDPNKTWFIYLMGDNGNTVGYYVARTYPVNICTFLTPPDKVEGRGDRARVRKAPALDGVYYGDGACNKEYFITADSDTMVMIPANMKKFISDQPLELDAQPIKVSSE